MALPAVMISVEMPLVQSMASVAPAVPLPGGAMTFAVGLCLLGFAVNTIGSCCRLVDFTLMMWRVCRRGARAILRWNRTARVEMKNKMVQSQTTYTLKSTAPRFQPLADWKHGCWED